MAQFKVFQFQLSYEDIALVNKEGWDASPKLKAYMNVRFGTWAPVAHKYYDLVAEIEAMDLEQAFNIGNIGPESAITRKMYLVMPDHLLCLLQPMLHLTNYPQVLSMVY